MSASTIPRPTENAAIGNWRPPRLHPPMWLYDRQRTAQRAGDMYLATMLGHAATRSLAGGKVGE